jgi:CubicO group peptidase (beta-lactamase class C family)
MKTGSFSIGRLATVTLLAGASFLFRLAPVCAETADPATDERVQQAIATIDSLAQKAADDKTVVGLAIAVVHRDKVVFAKGYGLREVGTDQKVDADTVFQLASVSKPVSATVVAQLVGEGKITWDSKISDLDSSFEVSEPWVSREITIRDFFCHRSGWPEHAGDLLEDIGYDRDEIMHRMRYQRPETSFRSHYAYTNCGLTEAAVAAAKKYGLSWESASEEKLFKPLQMNSTSARFSDFIARPNRALSHVRIGGKWAQKYRRQPDAQSPAGGISSSVNDMSRWMRLQLSKGQLAGKQIVSAVALAETHKPQMLTSLNRLNGLPIFYGLGIGVNYDEQGRLHLSHSGGFAMGTATNVIMIPSEQLGVVVLTNSYPIGLAEGLAATFTDLAVDGKLNQDWIRLYKKVFDDPATLGLTESFDYSKAPAVASVALPNDAYMGTYTNNFFGDISINENDGGLQIVIGPQKVAQPMRHYNRDIFTYATSGENAAGASGITFLVSTDGKASAVTVENLNIHGQGTFTRAATKRGGE